MLKINSKAPELNLTGDDGKVHKLSNHLGKLVVIYFYPKDDTPGCTAESCDFRDSIPEFEKNNCIIYGISRDNLNSHKKFKTKYNLNFILLSDPNLQAHQSYEVINEGKIVRSTFLINEIGNIIKIWKKVIVKDHVKSILKEAFILKNHIN